MAIYDRSNVLAVEVNQYGNLITYGDIISNTGVIATSSSGTPFTFKCGATAYLNVSSTGIAVTGAGSFSGAVSGTSATFSGAALFTGGSFTIQTANHAILDVKGNAGWGSGAYAMLRLTGQGNQNTYIRHTKSLTFDTGSATTATLSTSGNFHAYGTLSCASTATLGGAVLFNSTLYCTGVSTFEGGMKVKGAATGLNTYGEINNSDTYLTFYASSNSTSAKGYKFHTRNTGSSLALTIDDANKLATFAGTVTVGGDLDVGGANATVGRLVVNGPNASRSNVAYFLNSDMGDNSNVNIWIGKAALSDQAASFGYHYDTTAADRYAWVIHHGDLPGSGMTWHKGGVVGINAIGMGGMLNVGERGGGTADINIGIDNNNRSIFTYNGGKLTIGTRYSSTNYFDTLTVQSGNVGIGTTDPGDYKLYVAGKMKLYGTSNNAADVLSQTDGSRKVQHWFVNDAQSWSIGQLGTTSNPGYRFIIKDETSDNERLSIKTDGNVGIGVINPAEALDVAGAREKHGGVTEYSNSFNMQGSTAYTFDITVPSEGGAGNSFLIICAYNHFYDSSFGAHRMTFASTRSTSLGWDDIKNKSTSAGGAWSFSKPNSTTLRISKSAGSSTGVGSGFIRVLWRNAIG
jgi:hypothetical protein